MVGNLLGLQCGYKKFPCFLCLWDSRARAQQWIKQNWPVKEELVPGGLCSYRAKFDGYHREKFSKECLW